MNKKPPSLLSWLQSQPGVTDATRFALALGVGGPTGPEVREEFLALAWDRLLTDLAPGAPVDTVSNALEWFVALRGGVRYFGADHAAIAFDVAWDFDERARCEAMAALAPYLPPSLADEAARLAVEGYWARGAWDDLSRALPAPLVASHLPTAFLVAGPSALPANASLATLIPWLPDEWLEPVLLAVGDMSDQERISLRAAVLPRLLEPRRTEILLDALSMARRQTYHHPRIASLAHLAALAPPPLQASLWDEIMAMLRASEHGAWTSMASLVSLLVNLAEASPLRRDPLLRAAFAMASRDAHPFSRAEHLAALALRLPPELRRKALHGAVAAVPLLYRDSFDQHWVLSIVQDQLSAEAGDDEIRATLAEMNALLFDAQSNDPGARAAARAELDAICHAQLPDARVRPGPIFDVGHAAAAELFERIAECPPVPDAAYEIELPRGLRGIDLLEHDFTDDANGARRGSVGVDTRGGSRRKS